MAWTRITSATTTFLNNKASISLATTFSVQAGDVLIAVFGASDIVPTGIAISDGTNTWVQIDKKGISNGWVFPLVVVNSAALTNPTFVATNSAGGNIAGWGQLSVHQFRPPTGSTVSLDGTPVGTGVNAASAATPPAWSIWPWVTSIFASVSFS